jgi:DNA polymerase-1
MGTGPKKPKLMIVGEAPGAREDESHQAFVGPAGKLLTTLLEEVGISREDCYITNAVKCRPPDNATPSPSETRTCREAFFERELQQVNPEYVLGLGNTALLALVGKKGITKERGKLFPIGSLNILCTFHPAAALRSASYLPHIRADFAKIARLLKGDSHTDPVAPRTKTKLIRDSAQLGLLIKRLERSDEIAFDLETTGLHEWADGAAIVTLGVSWAPGEAAVVPLYHNSVNSRTWKPYALEELKSVLEDPTKKYIAHNAKFDCKWLAKFGIYVPITFDTMIAAHLLDENRAKGLKPLSEQLLQADGYELSKVEMKDVASVPIKKLALYNGKDCDYTLRLYHLFRDQLKEEPRTARLFKKLLMPASRVFEHIEMGGVYVDPERLATRTEKAAKIIVQLESYMRKYSKSKTINFNSPAQVAVWLFNDLKLPIIEETGTGAPSTKESVLLQLAKKHEAVRALLKYRKWSKYLSTYLLPWARVDSHSRIHPSYRLTGTVTGRLSSSNPNLQQVPRDTFIRGIIGAQPGWSFVEADYSQVELRVAAMLAHEHNMLRSFAMNEDIHMKTACATTGKSPDEVTKEERKKAKAINFGFLYGMGASKFVMYARDNYGVVVSLAEAEQVRDRFFSSYPNLRPWHTRQRRLAQRYQRIQSPIGRIRHLPDMLSSDQKIRAEAERQAINSPVQGFASDLMLVSAMRLDSTLQRKVARIVGSVHDSLLFEVYQDHLDSTIEVIRETMEDTAYIRKIFGTNITVPIEVEIKVGQHWSEGTIVDRVK